MTARTTSLLATACVTALAALPASPALAAERTFRDVRDDVAHGVDLQTVRLVNERNVRVVVQHENLVRSPRSGAGMIVWFDTDRSRKGPEYALAAGLFEGTDSALVETDGWRLGERVTPPAGCDSRVRADYRQDVSRIRLTRSCLGRPGEVRVSLRADGQRKGGEWVTDWWKSRRALTSWVDRG